MIKIYPFGYNSAAMSILEGRTVQQEAATFLQYLMPNMQLLDVGCGPGNITLGFAEILNQGCVWGIDIEPSQIEISKNKKSESGLKNCQFQVANIRSLPFEEQSFDAIWISHVLLNLEQHEMIITELNRVLKKNGIIGIHEPYTEASLIHPRGTALDIFHKIQSRSVSFNGGDPNIGKRLPKLLVDNSFEVIEISAVPFVGNTPEQRILKAEKHARLWEESDFPKQALQQRWISEETYHTLPAKIREEAKDMTLFAGRMQIKVIARKIK